VKILHLTNHLNPGGISFYVYTIACEMKRRAHQSFVLSSEGSLVDHFQDAGIKVLLMIPKTKSELDPRLYFVCPMFAGLLGEKALTCFMSQFIPKASGENRIFRQS